MTVTTAPATTGASATVAVAEAQSVAQQQMIDRLTLMIMTILSASRAQFTVPTPAAVRQVVDLIEQAQRLALMLAATYLTSVLRAAGDPGAMPPWVAPARFDRDAAMKRWAPVLEHPETLDQSTVETLAREEITSAVADGLRRGASATPKVIGYRRVIHPEMSLGGTCGLCAVASLSVYKHGNLKRIHDNCNCQVLPITRMADPGSLLNKADLKSVYDAAGGTADGWTLKQARIRFTQDGEMQVVRSRTKKGAVDSSPWAKGVKGAWSGEFTDKGLLDQIALTESLKDSDWRTAQLARLYREKKKRGL